ITRSILSNTLTATALLDKHQRLKDEVAGPIRNASRFDEALEVIKGALRDFDKDVKVDAEHKLWIAYRLRDALIAQYGYITAMKAYVARGGKSRGSGIYSSSTGSVPSKMEKSFRFELDDGSFNDEILSVLYLNNGFTTDVRAVRPLPEGGGFFENVWRDYRENKNIY
ncbi:MAG: hypothetical protein II980_01160, partial [Clostridia bacterium]|nr:hypothetical protein [Clostridia bacterium]